MPTMWKYINGDRVLGADGNYETTPGVWPAVIAEMESEAMEIDGETYGNRVFLIVERGSDSDQDREVMRRCYLDVGERYQDRGQIENLAVVVDDPLGLEGVGVGVSFKDIQAGLEVKKMLHPWGRTE